MLSNSNSSLAPSSDNNYYNQTLSPTYSFPSSHYKSTPNVAFYFDDQTEQRRLSDGPLLRLPNYNLHYPGEFGGSESCVLKQKNSSLSMLLDSTNSMMRTASTTFHSLFGAPRRASFCGNPDPTIQLSPDGNSGSLYLLHTKGNSNESLLSNLSGEEQRRTVTIYDGRIPSTPAAPTIPFELMTPFDAITQTIDDPVESFVQIVLEEPDDRPLIMPPPSSSRRNSPSRHRSSSPRHSLTNEQLVTSEKKLTDKQSLPITDLFNSLEIYCQPPEVVEPMDFSFLEPVLRGESAAPPPIRTQNSQQTSPQINLTNEDSTINLRLPSRIITITTNDSTVPELSSDDNNQYLTISSSCLKVPSSID